MAKRSKESQEAIAWRIAAVDNMSIEEVCILARIGMNALVDEATGYQRVRPKDDLRRQLKEKAMIELPMGSDDGEKEG